ncbi:hypothetical protein AB0M29_11745 [Streptomyces sp. NPDC051976]|uniref:hypothetical protein n=1 Tax=Streptomyces sp. NPDC051976 TaxID=3154947 RepID=UPI003422BF96
MSSYPSPNSPVGPRTPEQYAPPGRAVPDFPPIRAGGRRPLLGGAVGRRTLAAGLAVTAAALAGSAAYGAAPRPVAAARGPAARAQLPPGPLGGAVVGRRRPPGPPATHDASDAHGPVRVPRDAGGEQVRAPVRIADAAAVALLRPGDRVDVLAGARVVASGVPVVAVPGPPGAALVLLSVPRRTAAALSGAALASPLAVALC